MFSGKYTCGDSGDSAFDPGASYQQIMDLFGSLHFSSVSHALKHKIWDCISLPEEMSF